MCLDLTKQAFVHLQPQPDSWAKLRWGSTSVITYPEDNARALIVDTAEERLWIWLKGEGRKGNSIEIDPEGKYLAVLFGEANYGGRCETFTTSDPN